MNLIGDTWSERLKLWSVKICAILSAFFSLAILFSEQLLKLWAVVPQNIKDLVPAEWGFYIGLIVSVLTLIVRLKPQPKLHPEPTILGFASLPMGRITFDDAFNRLIGHEGGYTIARNDPGNWTGGAVGKGVLKGTKYGIAANTYPLVDIKNLTLAQAKEIYKRDWWDKLGAEGIHSAITFQLWDFAVNAGKSRAIKELQQAVGVTADGVIGAKTIAAVNSFDVNDVILTLTAERLRFYTSLSNWPVAGKGWTNRVADNLKYAAKDN